MFEHTFYRPLVLALFAVGLTMVLLACVCASPEAVEKQGDAATNSASANSTDSGTSGYQPGVVLVKFNPETDIETFAAQWDLQILRVVSEPDLYLMKIPANATVEQALETLNGHPAVSYAEPNTIRKLD